MKRFLLIFLLILSAGLLFAQDEDVLLDYKLRKVIFKGNQSFKNNQLKQIIDIKPVITKRGMQRISYRFIKSQTKTIKNYYISEGFLNCTVQDSLIIYEKEALHLYFNINENERFTLKQISIEGNTLLSDGEILEILDLRIGDPFRQYIYYNNFKKILSRYSELGHPFATIREEFDWSSNLEITLYINEDMSYQVKNISIKGNKTVYEESIRKHLKIEENTPYQLEKINRTQDRIYEMGAFNSVNIVPVKPDSTAQTLNLDVNVVESKTRRFDVQFGARQGYTEEISYSSLFIQPEWVHKNILHRAHRLSMGVTYEALFHNIRIDHAVNAEIAYTVPWLVVFRLPTTLKIYYDRNVYSPFSDRNVAKNDTITDYGINLSSIWRYNRKIYTRGSFALKNVKSESSGKGFEPLTEFTLQSRFDNRDNFIYPTKGWNILLYGGYVVGIQEATETQYFRLETSINRYTTIFRNLVLAMRIDIGQFFDRKTIDPLYLYRMGSETTVRGWFQSIGDLYQIVDPDQPSILDTLYAGKAKLMANVELRFDLIWNFGVNAFIDAGRLDNDFSEVLNWDGYYVNTGFGIYYKTPIGPIRIELPIIINDPNIGLNRDPERTFFTRIKFGLLFAF
ncbi:MAG: BamA/TamA family outer membrane protein [Candidatus Marinimicrobia bacterium]|nr:BamA/TamA family outer membrane protein [Candidatus Neomarinimicrobiota bacterium]